MEGSMSGNDDFDDLDLDALGATVTSSGHETPAEDGSEGPGLQVLGIAEDDTRGWRWRRSDAQLEVRRVPAEQLRESVSSFLSAISESVLSAPVAIGDFRLTEVTVKAEVTAKGTVSLLGTG